MAYHYTGPVTVTNEPQAKPDHLKWCKPETRPPYMVRSNAGGFDVHRDHCDTLTEARKVAQRTARVKGWAEIYRWAEGGTMLKTFFVAAYERELSA